MGETQLETFFSFNQQLSVQLLQQLKPHIVTTEGLHVWQQVYDALTKQQLFQDYLQNAINRSVIIAITDRKGDIVYANDWFCQVSHYTREELIGQNHRLLNSGYHSPQFFADMWHTILRGHKWEGEIKNRNKHGEFYWVKTVIVPLLDLHQQPHYFISIRSDITEGKKAQEALLNSVQHEYHETIRSLDNIIFKLKREVDGHRVTMVEGKLVEKLKLKADTFVGRTVEQLAEWFDDEPIQVALQTAFSGHSFDFKWRIREHCFFVSLSPIAVDGEVKEVVGHCSDLTQFELFQQQIEFMAYHDQMTHLPNKRKLLLDSERWTTDTLVVLLHIQNLTQMTELFGHHMAEQFTKVLADQLVYLLKDGDFLYRIDHQRFLFTTKDETLAQRALHVLKGSMPVGQLKLNPLMTIGTALYPFDGVTCDELVMKAAIALRYSHECQSAIVAYHTIRERHEEKTYIEEQLRTAMDRNILQLYFQPKWNVQTNEMTGMEALLRWPLADGSFISPATFIPIAEECGLIYPLGHWVLQKACAMNADWIARGYHPQKIAVNVSPQQFEQDDFVASIEEILAETNLASQWLELEITENCLLENSLANVEKITRLRELGITVAIDDFGTGYSSLGYIKVFPVSSLKIDQSFIRDTLTDEKNRTLVETIIHIAHAFQLEVVAEGVESQEVIDLLRESGCEQVQGYYYSQPLCATDFERQFLMKTSLR